MIQIYIDNKLVDTDNTNISLQKEFSDEIENIPVEVEYSYTISLPASLNNKEVFGYIDTFDVANKFARIYNAELYVDETLILKGKFKMTSIEEGHFKGNIYSPKKKTISDILGDRSLNEIKPHHKPMNKLLDFSKTNNIVCGLSDKEEELPYEWRLNKYWDEIKDNHIVYPYVLYGHPLNNTDIETNLDKFTQDLEYGKHNISENNIFPAFNVLSILKDMFATEGYNLTGNIFNTENSQYFNKLYQTFQYGYDDYIKEKEIPFYCHFNCYYNNAALVDIATPNPRIEISPTLQIADLWEQSSFESTHGRNPGHDGIFRYGVDNPMQAGSKNASIGDIVDDKNMLALGSTDKSTGIVIIPKSGWYKIKCDGMMRYALNDTAYAQENRTMVGGCHDEADNTDLSEQPFEFQIKKGTPAENPQLYSFNSFIPCVGNSFVEDKSVLFDCNDTYLQFSDRESNRRYGKNGKTTYIKDYSNFPTNDFICGARLGDAWFSSQWAPGGRGWFRRENRFMSKGAGMALLDTSKAPVFKTYNDESVGCPYKTNLENPYANGKYVKLSGEQNNLTYGVNTAQVLVRNNPETLKSSYSNFEGYNQLNDNGWDTTSNYGKVTYAGADDSSARTISEYAGEWSINTVVWLEEGDTLYTEVLMPLHTKAEYTHSTGFRSSSWDYVERWVNKTTVKFTLDIGFLNSRSDWKPKAGDGILSFDDIKNPKLTNVNKFLPNVKCNDYLEKFLKTFNLQLTMVNENTFSIDSNVNLNLMTNVIDIDKMVNISDAEFKPLKSDSVKQLCWKNDLGETGYVHGNNSPYAPQVLFDTQPWNYSGYTGNYSIVNETNTSGSIKKVESQWSYNWYKTIKLMNQLIPTTGIETYEPSNHTYYGELDVPVICDAELFEETATPLAFQGEKPKTNKTSRLFFVEDGTDYIRFVYDKVPYNGNIQTLEGNPMKNLMCNIIIPSKTCYTVSYDGNQPMYIGNLIDYNKVGIKAWRSITEKFFNENINGGYDIEVPIKLSNQQYADVKQGTLFKLNDGLYRVKSIEGHDVNKLDDATLTLTTLK